MNRKFQVRESDRRKENVPVSRDRRDDPRRTADRQSRGRPVAALKGALRGLEELIKTIEADLAQVKAAHDPSEVTQIPTRNECLAGAVRQLSETQAGLVALVRGAQQAGLLTAELRSWVREVAAHAGEAEEGLAAHMAERLGLDQPAAAPRVRRLTDKLDRLLA